MQKRILNILLLPLFFILICSLTNCSSSKAIQNPVVGIIEVVGNEPFTRLAVNINNKDVYLLECTKELKDELLKNQGKVYEIVYTEIKKTGEGNTLIVKKITPIKIK